jgi:hypothetical protein
MANNAGLLLMAGLGALMFLGRGGATKKLDADPVVVTGPGGAGPTPGPKPGPLPAFDIATYIDGLFGQTATVPKQPPTQFFFPPNVVVTSSGVPGVSSIAPDIITSTTKAGIDSAGDRSIAASSLEVIRQEEIVKQQFAAAANVQPRTWAATVEANRVAAMQQMATAKKIMAANKARQQAARNIAALRSRNAQEAAALAAMGTQQADDFGFVEVFQPTINIDDTSGEFSINRSVIAGQPIITQGPDMDDPGPEYYAQSARDSSPRYSESFVISGGMDSPAFLGEEEDYQPTTVHELSAAYDIGF